MHPGVGTGVGDAVGDAVGLAVGASVGEAVGDAVGDDVGDAVGEAVGLAVGDVVGDAVGDAVGLDVISTQSWPTAWYPSSHSSMQLSCTPWSPLLTWCAFALCAHEEHTPSESWPHPKRYWPTPQSSAHGWHEFVAAS